MEWCFFVLTELDAASLYVIRRHEGLTETYGEAPAAVEAARRYFQSQMRSVDCLLSDDRPFVLGERFSAADVMLCTCLSWALRRNIEVSNKVASYLAAVMARPAFQRALSCNADRARA